MTATAYTVPMLHLIIWVVIGLLALSFFGISLRAIAGSPTNQDNMAFLMETLRQGVDHLMLWLQPLIDVFR